MGAPVNIAEPPGTRVASARHTRSHYQDASFLLRLHHAFNMRADLVGTDTACAEFKEKVNRNTLAGWRNSIGELLPDADHLRRFGGGSKPVFSHSSELAVYEEAVKLRAIAPVSFVQLRYLFSQQPHQHPGSARSKNFKCSDSFLQEWMTEFNFELEAPSHNEDDKARVQRTREQLRRPLQAVYAFRLNYLLLHVPPALRNLSLEPYLTWHRIFMAHC